MPRFGGMGGAFGRMGGGGPAAAASGLSNAETTTWVSAVVGDGGSVSAGRQTLVDSLITSLKSGSVWTTLDRLWLFAGENSQSALRDIVAAAQATLTDVPTFAVDRGYTTDGVNDLISTGFNPSSAPSPKFVQNSGSVSVWSRTVGQTAASGMGTPATAVILINPRNGSDQTSWRVNQTAASDVGANTDGTGFFTGTRTGAGATEGFRNGVSVGTGTTASVAVPNAAIAVGEVNTVFCNRQFAAAAIGAGRNGTVELAFYNAMQTYMTAVGA